MSKSVVDKIEAMTKIVPEGPWFAAADEAEDSPPHRNSGLALVDTGRISDWPIARLCEWNTAKYIATIPPEHLAALVKYVRAAEAWICRPGQPLWWVPADVSNMDAFKANENRLWTDLQSARRELGMGKE